MFIWARACVYARTQGHVLVRPKWAQMDVGSWIRWERDKRTYGGLFRRLPDTPMESTIHALKRYPEADAALFEADASGDSVLCFEGIEPGFAPLLGHRELLWRELCATASEDLPAWQATAGDKIGFGIRLGDFKSKGWATPLSWFEKRLRELRDRAPNQEVWIFSDGTDEELAGLLVDPLVTRAPEVRSLFGSSALTAIAQISGTKAMVVTGGSSLYRWGVFLGGVPTIAHAADHWHAPIWTQLSRVGLAFAGGRCPSPEDWSRVLATPCRVPGLPMIR